MATTPQHPAPKQPDPRHPATPSQRPANQPQGTVQNQPRPQGQQGQQGQQDQQRQHEDQSRPKSADPSKGKDPDSPSGVAADYNTKPADQGGGDQSPHPSPATDPTNAPPEPSQWTEDNPRPPLPKGRDYVAGQPVTQEEYELTEKEQAERVRPEAWERLKGQGVEVEDGMKDASTGWDEEARKRAEKSESRNKDIGWDRDKEGTRPDARALRRPEDQDDDVNKAPGGGGGQGTRADGRARSPDMPGEGPNDRGERVEPREERHRPSDDL
jgi:hypothetical protein